MDLAMTTLKKRNPLVKELRDPQGLYSAKVERDKTKFYRKLKHKNKAEDGLDSKDT